MGNYNYYSGQRTWKKSKASDFRNRLSFQKKGTPIRDTEGNNVPSYTTAFTVWGSMEGIRGREMVASGALSGEVTYRIRIRYRKDIQTDMRIQQGDRFFEIESAIDMNEEHKEIEIMCKELNVNG
ncbi:phage head closure protein [Fictibacillus aquaticus]|uniref:Head-tail adaptor protein n=1 Tax=Fictibacillus aquaticus TaxID=2021314 RepID=A0A235FA52_9BACL|nr:phage head closure protein [Fictibacillus aquaticus]OYD57873.1 hypothetical protein CGZ90_08195 [Fictibacillus aquaticus]